MFTNEAIYLPIWEDKAEKDEVTDHRSRWSKFQNFRGPALSLGVTYVHASSMAVATPAWSYMRRDEPPLPHQL